MTTALQFFEKPPSSKKKPSNLVILLHGYGSNGEDLLNLSLEFNKILPDAHFISPNAPFEFEAHINFAYQWFSLANLEPHIIAPQIIEANNILDQFIKSQLERFSLQAKNLILVGFSQGSMMAMYNSLRSAKEIGGIVAYSGKLILPTSLSEQVKSKPPICLIHGKADLVVPFSYMSEAVTKLNNLEIPFESHGIENLEHTIDAKGIAIAKRFLNKIK